MQISQLRQEPVANTSSDDHVGLGALAGSGLVIQERLSAARVSKLRAEDSVAGL